MDLSLRLSAIVFIIALAYLLKKAGILRQEDAGGLTRIILNVTLPAVVVGSFLRFQIQPHYLLLTLLVVVLSLVVFALAYWLLGSSRYWHQNLFRISLVGLNIGLFSYPIIEMVYGFQGLSIAVLVDFGNAMVIFGFSYILCLLDSRGEAEQVAKSSLLPVVSAILRRLLTFIPFVSYIVAIGLSLWKVPIPALGLDLLQFIAGANTVLVLLLLGITFEFRLSRQRLKEIAILFVLRYSLAILAAMTAYWLLPFDKMIRSVVVICFLSPVGMAIIPYSFEFGYDSKTAASTVNLSNIISLAAIYIFILWSTK